MILVSNGNKKIGNNTLIINMNSATDCPSRRLGLCNIEGNKCYALKAERIYPQVLPYRRKQYSYWKYNKAEEILDDLKKVIDGKRNPIKYLRFSEAGDFESQEDIEKMKVVSSGLIEKNVKVYGYTARKDLNFKNLPSNMAVNGSGFMISNSFTAVKEIKDTDISCVGNCRFCNLCKQSNGLDIKVLYH